MTIRLGGSTGIISLGSSTSSPTSRTAFRSTMPQRSVEKVKKRLSAAGARPVAGRDVFVYFVSGAKVRNPVAAYALIKRLK